MRSRELVYGFVREPPAPKYGHQSVVTQIGAALLQHARDGQLGLVCVSPIDVILDRDRALVVQPDLVFISQARAHIVRDRIWGAPDLVVEVLSPRTARRDRTIKLGWYRRYGVRECWLVDARARRIEVVDLTAPPGEPRVFGEDDSLRSGVLLTLRLQLRETFQT
jgi:Uma2 family endonuclease